MFNTTRVITAIVFMANGVCLYSLTGDIVMTVLFLFNILLMMAAAMLEVSKHYLRKIEEWEREVRFRMSILV